MNRNERNEQIRQDYAAGATLEQVGEKYKLTKQRIAVIVADLPKHYGVDQEAQMKAYKEAEARRSYRRQQREECLRLYKDEKLSQEAIAAKMERSQSWVSSVIISALGANTNKRGPRSVVTPDMRARIKQMAAEGFTQTHIANELGISQPTVSSNLKEV